MVEAFAAKGSRSGKSKAGPKNCKKQVCGNSCIALTKTCLQNMSPAQLAAHQQAQKQAKAAKRKGGGGGGGNPAVVTPAGGGTPAPIPTPTPIPTPPAATPAPVTKPQATAKNPQKYTDAIAKGKALIPPDLAKDLDSLSLKMQEFQQSKTKLKELTAELKLAQNGVASRSLDAIVQEGRQLQSTVKKQSIEFDQLSGRMETFRQSLLDSSRLSKADADGLAAKIKIDDSAAKVIPASELRAHASEFYRLTNGKGSSTVERFSKDGDRACARVEKRMVNIGSSAEKAIIFHEMAHHLEVEVNAAPTALNWVRSKASGNPQQLSKITGNKNFRDTEIAYPDQFISPYVGKIYPVKGTDGKVTLRPATEVISMAVERMSSGRAMAEFYLNDPSHFNLVLGLIRGDE